MTRANLVWLLPAKGFRLTAKSHRDPRPGSRIFPTNRCQFPANKDWPDRRGGFASRVPKGTNERIYKGRSRGNAQLGEPGASDWSRARRRIMNERRRLACCHRRRRRRPRPAAVAACSTIGKDFWHERNERANRRRRGRRYRQILGSQTRNVSGEEWTASAPVRRIPGERPTRSVVSSTRASGALARPATRPTANASKKPSLNGDSSLILIIWCVWHMQKNVNACTSFNCLSHFSHFLSRAVFFVGNIFNGVSNF